MTICNCNQKVCHEEKANIVWPNIAKIFTKLTSYELHKESNTTCRFRDLILLKLLNFKFENFSKNAFDRRGSVHEGRSLNKMAEWKILKEVEVSK